MAMAALICGILGIIGGFVPIVQYFTFLLAVLGIVFGVKGRAQALQTGEGRGMATAGLVLGIIGTVFSAIGVVCTICAVALAESLNALY